MSGATTVDAEQGSPASRALHLVTADPYRARRLATAALRAAQRAGDAAEESTSERALGLAARELHDAASALSHLRRAVRVAQARGLAVRAAEARMSLALVLDEAGRPGAALRNVDRACTTLRGLPAARAQMQRAVILDRLGRYDEALDGYRRALAIFRRIGDPLWQARALTNRGVFRAYRGATRLAEADLRAAERLYTELGQELAVAQVRHNLGFVAARSGDVPAALRWYDLADEYFRRTHRPAVALIDRGELLLRARLLPEAREAAQAAVTAARGSGMALHLAQAQLMLAEVALAMADAATAREHGTAAAQAFARQRRPGWAALARYAVLRAGDPGASAAKRRSAARAIAADLAATGWPAAAMDARLYAAQLAPDQSVARSELEAARAAGRRGPAELRARAWHAEALLRLADGDVGGARRALLAGIRVLDGYRAALGATELRTLASSYALDLARTGMRVAMAGGIPRDVLFWAEQSRAAALRLPPARPPDEAALAADLAALRRVVAEVDESASLNGTGPSSALAGRLREQRAIEDRIRRRSWHAAGSGPVPGPPRRRDALRAALGERALVELVEHAGRLHAVVVSGSRYRMCDLGPPAEILTELDALRFALRRVAVGHGSAASLDAAAQAGRYAAERLDHLLLAPARSWLGDRPLVLVPVGPLHALPWAVLPSCRGRPVTVAPSVAAWLAAGSAGTADGRAAVLVSGPGLPQADAEVRALARRWAPAAVFTGQRSRVEPVLSALDGAGLAHLAAHGEFRADNPAFSQIRLADGPLTVYDLQRLRRAPAVVVLSACDSGLSGVRPGEELMGLTAALLELGTGTVIGSLLPTGDAVARELMLALHRGLHAGTPPAVALAQAQSTVDPASAVFCCLGAG